MNPETKGKHNVGKDQDKGKEREKEGTGDAMKIKRMTNEIGDGGEIKELLYLKPKKKKKILPEMQARLWAGQAIRSLSTGFL